MNNFLGKKKNARLTKDSDFRKTVAAVVKAGDEGTVSLYRTDEGTGPVGYFLYKGDIKEFQDMEIEPYLKQNHWGGKYKVRIDRKDKDGQFLTVKEFHYSIAGEPKEPITLNDKRRDKQEDSYNKIMENLVTKSFEMATNRGDDKLVAALNGIFGQMLEMQRHNTELLISVLSGGKGEEDILDKIIRLKQAEEMITPKIEAGDKSLEWFRTIAGNPILTGIAAKMLGINMPNMTALPEVAISPPGTSGIGLPAAESKPPRSTPAENKLNEQQQASPLNGGAPASGDEEDQEGDFEADAFESLFLDTIRAYIKNDAAPDAIAVLIQKAVEWSLLLVNTGKPAHPAMETFCGAFNGSLDIAKIEKAFDQFAGMIEIPADKIADVKAELIKIYMPILMQMQAQQAGDEQNEAC